MKVIKLLCCFLFFSTVFADDPYFTYIQPYILTADRAPTEDEQSLTPLVPNPAPYPGVYIWDNTLTNQFWIFTGGDSEHMQWLQFAGAGTDNRIYNYPSRAFNNPFQMSATNDTHFTYSILASATANSSGSFAGTLYLEYADDAAFTTNIQTVWYMPFNGDGLTPYSSNPVAMTVSGEIPAGKYVKLTPSVSSGTITFNIENTQEVQE